jgi:hypothetical protein
MPKTAPIDDPALCAFLARARTVAIEHLDSPEFGALFLFECADGHVEVLLNREQTQGTDSYDLGAGMRRIADRSGIAGRALCYPAWASVEAAKERPGEPEAVILRFTRNGHHRFFVAVADRSQGRLDLGKWQAHPHLAQVGVDG